MKWLENKTLSTLALSVLLCMSTGVTAKSEVNVSQQVKQVAQPDKSYQQVDYSVNINIASEIQLIALKGIGEAKAKAIVDYRSKNGKFRSVDGLTSVPGIGKVIVEQNRHYIKL